MTSASSSLKTGEADSLVSTVAVDAAAAAAALNAHMATRAKLQRRGSYEGKGRNPERVSEGGQRWTCGDADGAAMKCRRGMVPGRFLGSHSAACHGNTPGALS